MTTRTTDQEQEDLTIIASVKNKNERLSWKRKYDRLQEMIDNEIRPLEDLLLKTLEKKLSAMDRIEELRKQMIKECIHPKNNLIHKGDHVLCKFCNANISLPK